MEAVNKQKGMNGNVKDGIQKPQQIDGTQVPVEGVKKPIFKKWWFWVAIGAVVLVGALVFFII